jgi:uncharacterized protein
MPQYTPEKLLKDILKSPASLITVFFTLVACVLTALGLGAISQINNSEKVAQLATPQASAGIVKFANTNQEINVELALDNATWEKGLMSRTGLDTNSGMLFIFPTATNRSFWMKDTLIPLDIIFLDSDLRVLNIHKNTKPNQTIELYSSNGPAKYVLEVNAGWSRSHGIQPGQELVLISVPTTFE